MAKLSAHGLELLRLEYATSRVAYFGDGKILRNQGDGWKLWRKVKPGVDVVEHAKARKASHESFLDACPSWARFIRLMRAAGNLEKRGLLLCIIELMPDDVDGVWSHANDDLDLGLSVEDCQDLCYCYREGIKERDARRAAIKSNKN